MTRTSREPTLAFKNMVIKPARNYAAIRKANRAAKLKQVKQTLLSWVGFVVYAISLAIMFVAFYIIAVALM